LSTLEHKGHNSEVVCCWDSWNDCLWRGGS